MKKGSRAVDAMERAATEEQLHALMLEFVEEYQHRHRVKKLQDGTQVVECLCGKTIAITKKMDHHLCVEVRLLGSASKTHVLRVNSGGKCPNSKCNKGHALMETVLSLLGYDNLGVLYKVIRKEVEQTDLFRKYLPLKDTSEIYLLRNLFQCLIIFHLHQKYLLRPDLSLNDWEAYLAKIISRCDLAMANTKLA